MGVRACRVLADGRLLSVNGLGVVEQFAFSWRDWHVPAAATASSYAREQGEAGVGAETAAGVLSIVSGEEEEGVKEAKR